MKTVKEGTHICLQQQIIYGKDNAEDKELEYYLSIEYEVLKRNQLKTLLPVQLREKDREKNLLFDITGKQPIKKQGSGNIFRQKDCEGILQSIINLLEELDNYMLNLNYVEFRAEYMYIGADGQLQWIYSPQVLSETQNESEEGSSGRNICQGRQGGFQERIESFFAWMLTQINYEDSNVVQFMYQLYNKVRKLGFSKELLEKYLQSRRDIDACVIEEKQENRIQSQKNVNQNSMAQRNMNENNENQKNEYQKNTAKRNTNKRNTNQKNGYQKRVNQRNGYQKNMNRENAIKINKKIAKQDAIKNNRVHNLFGIDTMSNLEHRNPGQNKANLLYNCVRILFCILFLCSFILEGLFIFSGIQEGFSESLFWYCIGGGLLLLAFLFGIIWSNVKISNVKINNVKFSNDRVSNTKFKRTRKSEKANSYSYESIDTGIADIENTDTGIAGRPLIIKTDVDWESDGMGTTILGGTERENGMPENCIYPMLQEVETGIVYIIKNCPFYIGSAVGVNQLEIPDKTVSREHAVILEDFQEEEYMGYIIRDMNSTNGTWINGRKMKKGSQEPLKEGEIIRFAQKEYKFLLQDIS